MSCCDRLNNAMTTLRSCVHNTFVKSNIKHIGDKNLIYFFWLIHNIDLCSLQIYKVEKILNCHQDMM
jgi:hypothetical protein